MVPAPGEHAGVAVAVPSSVTWVDRRGVQHSARTDVRGPHPAGDTLAGWTDRSDRLVPAPTSASSAVLLSAWWAGVLLAGILAALAAIWWALTRWTLSRNCQRWAWEWAEVEPIWSGRQ
jgi:hypothetical protein